MVRGAFVQDGFGSREEASWGKRRGEKVAEKGIGSETCI